jgi:2-oxoglutarate ferredoxin oxidoreductase subunit delta
MEQDAAAAPEEAAPGLPSRRRVQRGRVRIFTNWCKGCGLCIAFCPQKVFEFNGGGRASVAHPEKCTACDWCRLHCPDLAIVVARVAEEEAGGAA